MSKSTNTVVVAAKTVRPERYEVVLKGPLTPKPEHHGDLAEAATKLEIENYEIGWYFATSVS